MTMPSWVERSHGLMWALDLPSALAVKATMAMRLRQLQMALVVPDDSFPRFWPLNNIYCITKCDNFHLGKVAPSYHVFTSDGASLR